MKANAPEKIYLLHDDRYVDDLSIIWFEAPYATGSIEYVRTDAFIEKACKWIKTNMDDYIHVEYDIATGMPTNEAHIADKKVVEDFKNYIKGE